MEDINQAEFHIEVIATDDGFYRPGPSNKPGESIETTAARNDPRADLDLRQNSQLAAGEPHVQRLQELAAYAPSSPTYQTYRDERGEFHPSGDIRPWRQPGRTGDRAELARRAKSICAMKKPATRLSKTTTLTHGRHLTTARCGQLSDFGMVDTLVSWSLTPGPSRPTYGTGHHGGRTSWIRIKLAETKRRAGGERLQASFSDRQIQSGGHSHQVGK